MKSEHENMGASGAWSVEHGAHTQVAVVPRTCSMVHGQSRFAESRQPMETGGPLWAYQGARNRRRSASQLSTRPARWTFQHWEQSDDDTVLERPSAPPPAQLSWVMSWSSDRAFLSMSPYKVRSIATRINCMLVLASSGGHQQALKR